MPSRPTSRPRALRRSGEDGAIAPIVAVAISGLLVASLWGANTVSLYAVERELQRAADLGALAGAANLPLVGILSSGEPQVTACRYADDLLTPSRAPLATNLSATRAGPTCISGGVMVEPLVETALVDQAQAALQRLTDDVRAQLGSPDICAPLVRLLDPLLQQLTATDCARLQETLDGLPSNLAPATVTPRVRVSVADTVEAPVPVPGFFDDRLTLRSVATARRRFKNVIVLPATCPTSLGGVLPCTDLVSGAPAPLDNLDLGNLNPTAATACGTLLTRVQDANDALAAELAARGAAGFDLSQLILDARDLCDPPGNATPPSPIDLAAEAARTGDPVVVLRLFEMPVLGIPALDFTAAYLEQVGSDVFTATPIPAEQLTSARGLFGATLVG